MLVTEHRSRGTGDGMSRLFVDVTTSLMLAGDLPIGISRIEGEIARRLLLSSDLHSIPVVFRNDGQMLALSPEQLARIFSARPVADSKGIRVRALGGSSVAVAAEPAAVSAADQPAPHPPTRPLKIRLWLRVAAEMRRAARVSIACIPGAVREDIRAILIHVRQIVRTVIHMRRGSVPAPPIYIPAVRDEIIPTLRMVVHPRPGDVLWTAGLYRNFVPLRTIAETRVRTGLRVVTICYDLIRLAHPQFNAPSMGAELFAADAIALLDASDLVLAISETTRRDLLNYATRIGRAAPAVQVVRLGSDLSMREMRNEHKDSRSLPTDLARRRFALAVGTVEPRKNYRLLLRVWERLSADPTFLCDLVIVGRPGFEAEDSILEIERSPLFGSRVLWVECCPDEMLRQLYDACHVVLCPSFAEGWGLPIAEALSLGRHVIASNRGAMIEASQGFGRLLDPEDEESWAAAIAAAASAPRLEVDLPDPPNWDATAAAVKDHLRRFVTRWDGSKHAYPPT